MIEWVEDSKKLIFGFNNDILKVVIIVDSQSLAHVIKVEEGLVLSDLDESKKYAERHMM